MKRPSWNGYFLRMAEEAASRSTCNRARVGAVLVGDREVLSTGYNGTPRGEPHCDDVGHSIANGHCVAVVHAEANALLQVGRAARGATLYCTHSPCWECAKLIANQGVKNLFYGEKYWAGEAALMLLARVGCKVQQLIYCPKCSNILEDCVCAQGPEDGPAPMRR